MNVFELGILDSIQKFFKCDFLDTVMPLITKLGDGGIFWIIVALIMIITKKYRKTGIMMGVALLTGLLVCNLTLKPLISRVRPFNIPGADFEALIDLKTVKDKSFPSGHTVACFESATVLLINNKRLGIAAIIIAVLVAFSRLYLYVHYPTDVLFGALIGTAIGILSCFIVNKIINRKKSNTLK